MVLNCAPLASDTEAKRTCTIIRTAETDLDRLNRLR